MLGNLKMVTPENEQERRGGVLSRRENASKTGNNSDETKCGEVM